MLDELFAEAPAAISLLIVPFLQFRWFLTFEHGALFVQTFAHVSWEGDFRRFYNQTNLTRDKRSEIVFGFCFDCRAACSGVDILTRNDVSRVFVQYYGLTIPSNFFSFLQSKNYHKLFLQVFQKKGTILRKQSKKGLVLWLFLTFSFSHATGRTLKTENMLRHALWKVKENGFVKKQFKLSRCFCSPKNNSQLEKKDFAKSTGRLNR